MGWTIGTHFGGDKEKQFDSIMNLKTKLTCLYYGNIIHLTFI